MASGVYEAVADAVTVTAARSIIFLNPPTTCSIRILRCSVDQSGTTASQQLPVKLIYQAAAFPSSGTGITPAKTASLDGVSQLVSGASGAQGTVGVNYTTQGAGAQTVIKSRAFNNLNGWEFIFTPKEEIVLSAGFASGFSIYLPGTPTTLTGWNASIVYEEV
jgi:hypothetical protein